MRIAYLDCFAGVSGDMFLGALIDAGVDPQVLHEAVAALNLNASLKMEKVDRSGISCIKVDVLEGDALADGGREHGHSYDVDEVQEQRHQHSRTHQHHPKTQHQHKVGHDDSHDHDHGQSHEHSHGRSLTVIRSLIDDANLAAPVKQTAIRAFELLGESEAKIHNVPVEQIHFHEVGAVDAIVDIVAASAGIHALGVERWFCSALNVGGGMVDCAHGRFPVPAPATADLLRGFPTYSAHIEKELVTPTGAALIRAIAPVFGRQPAMRVDKIGYGAGTRNPKDLPNVLRISVGEAVDSAVVSAPVAVQVKHDDGAHRKHEDGAHRKHDDSAHRRHHHNAETVTVLETALDDLSPQILAYVSEKALELGALDVMLTPVLMKKGRPGTLITVLCNPSESHALEQMLLRETSTLGVRVRQDSRVCLDRHHASVSTPYGEIRMKIGMQRGEERNAAPEFEDCKAAAAKHDVPLKLVQQAAIAAFRR